jgi:hypothetical protein
VLTEDACVLDCFYTCRASAGYGFVVDHVFLEPQVWDSELDDLFNNGWYLVRSWEDLDKVDAPGSL